MKVVAYHGTYASFDRFEKTNDIGFHFSKSPYVAQNRLYDLYGDDLMCDNLSQEKGHLLTVELELSNPYDIFSDLGYWQAYDFFGFANMHMTKKPFKSPIEMFIYEQKLVAKNAYRYLKSIGFDKEKIQSYAKKLCPSFFQYVQKDSILNSEILEEIRSMSLSRGIDALIYQNDYECQDGCDNTCYLVLNSDSIKIIQRKQFKVT